MSPTLNTRIKLTHGQNPELRKTNVRGGGGEGGEEDYEVKRWVANHGAIFGNRRPSKRSKARLGKVEEEGKSLEANSKRDLSGPLLYLPWLCPPLTCVNTRVQMRMYTNIHHHLHDPQDRIKPSYLCAHKTSEYYIMDILCTL